MPRYDGGVAPSAVSVVIALPSGVMKRAVPGSDSIAVFAAMSPLRHGRRISRAVSTVGPSTFSSLAPGLSGGIIGSSLSYVVSAFAGTTC
jgi:hypothetical protein